MVRVSVIGCGNMGRSLIRGLALAETYEITAYDVNSDALRGVEDVAETTTDIETATRANLVVLAVKPDVLGDVLGTLSLTSDQTLVSLAAGISTDFVARRTDATVVRVMPNLAAETQDMAGAVTGDVDETVRKLLADVGEYVEIDESLMDTATAVNGSGPAFVFYLIEAMKEAGIEGGLEPAQAETLAAQTFKGAAETVLRDERSVDALIDAVCSPNGTTIEGMEVLRESDAKTDLVAAISAAEERSRELAEAFDGA